MIEEDPLSAAKASGWKIEKGPKGAAPPQRPTPTPTPIDGRQKNDEIVDMSTISADQPEKPCGIPIPGALSGCRFIKVAAGQKNAIERGWQDTQNYSIDDPVLLQHLAAGGNYGVMAGEDVCIVDADSHDLFRWISPYVDTFAVTTGRKGGGIHLYLRCPGAPPEKFIFKHPETGEDLGDLRGPCSPFYVVGPGSIHPSGARYEPIDPSATLLEVSWDELRTNLIDPLTAKKTEPVASPSRRPPEVVTVGGTISDQLGLRCEEFLMPLKPTIVGEEVHGEHPIHGSSTGTNLQINRQKNSWVCRRCNSGGGPLEALAVAEGIIQCQEAGPNCLDDHWPAIFEALRARGYNVISKNDTRRGIVLRRSKNPIKANEAREVLGCIARTLRLQNMQEAEILDQVAKINASRRMEGPVPDEEVLTIVREAYQAMTLSGARQKTELSRATPPELKAAADKILDAGEVLQYFRDVYETLHSGDIPILDSILCGFAVMSCINSNGIQPAVNGPMGGGKTSGVKAAIHLAPPERVFKTSLSNKALFYDERLRPGIAIFSDDTTLEDNLLDTIKRAMSNFQEPTEHLTVEKSAAGNRARTLIIPPRILFLFTSVEDTGDDQLCDRQYMISVDPTPEGDTQFLDFLISKVIEGREEFPTTDDVLVCREILRDLAGKSFRVRIPFADRVEFLDKSRRRNIGSFFDFCMASAILNYRGRPQGYTPGDEEYVITLSATIEDFEVARDIFRYNADTRTYDLNKEERALLDWLVQRDQGDGITEPEIIRDFRTRSGSPWSRGKVRRKLYGENNRGGLLQKVPGMWCENRILEIGERSRRAVNVIFTPKVVGSKLSDYEDWVRIFPESQNVIGDSDHIISTGG